MRGAVLHIMRGAVLHAGGHCMCVVCVCVLRGGGMVGTQQSSAWKQQPVASMMKGGHTLRYIYIYLYFLIYYI